MGCRVKDVLRVACFFALLLLPFLLAWLAGRDGFLWLAAGGVAWALSVVLKGLVTGLIEAGGVKNLIPRSRATVHGFVSALCELGAAALLFIWVLPERTAWHAAAFGAGAGGVEIVWLYILALKQPSSGESREPNPGSESPIPLHVEWTFVVERSGALVGHIGSRGLVWLAAQGTLWCGILALGTFASVDGLAAYGELRKWDWLELPRWKRFHGFVTAVSALEIVTFVCVSAFGSS